MLSEFWGVLYRNIQVSDLDHAFIEEGKAFLDAEQQRLEEKLQECDLQSVAVVAQTLIELTGFHRILHFDTEDVGGPVDLAVISRTGGFTWLKRKGRA